MTPEQYQRVKELFAVLEPLSAQARLAELRARGDDDDPVVRREVESLLNADVDAGRRLDHVGRQISTMLAPWADKVAAAGTRGVVGRRVGPYEIEGVLGQGGMGVVYLGHDTQLNRKAALKAVLPGGASDDGTMVERLRREARVLASLSHPNLATVYGLEESQGTMYLAMEYVAGKTLSARQGRGAMSIPDALHVCEQVAAGLEAAHNAGVIHRDLKPGNTMFALDGTVKVVDFGLARETRPRAADDVGTSVGLPLTQEGSFIGTPAYMSPEQVRCEAVDARSDVYSFGCVLFRCLAGRPPFEGETSRELFEAILTHEPDWSNLPAKLPPAVLGMLKRCLAKDPAGRYRHIGDARLDLHDVLAARAWEVRAPKRTAAATARHWAPWAVTVLTPLLVLAVTRPWARPTEVGGQDLKSVRRFDVAFPENAIQGDLERVQLALSPDGRDMVVACKTQERQALWMRSHADGRWRRIEQTDGAHRPFFSADGQWVGFYRDGYVFKHRLTGGGEPTRLATMTNWYGATLAEDGTLIYAAAWGDPLQRLGPGDAKPRPFTRLDAGRNQTAHVSPAAVPGGRWVLFNAWTGGEQCDVEAAPLNGGGEQHVVVGNASTPRLASTPRGEYLLFERGSIIFAAPFDRKTARVTGAEAAVSEGVMNDGTRFVAYFDVAADGSLVYFPGTSFAEESRLAYVNPDRTTTPFNDDRMSFCEPVFSPRGGKLAVLVKGKVYRALVYDRERQTRESVLAGGDTVAIAVSPDGQTLACTVNRDGGYGIDLISLVNGRRLGRVVQPSTGYQSDLTWSADGRVIVFSQPPREGVPADIFLVDAAEGSKARTLVSSPGADLKPAISPDGTWVAYQSDISGRAEIYLVTYPDGATTRQVTFGGGARPAWSPDGKTLYYVAGQGLMSVSVGTGGTVTGQAAVVYDKPFGQSDPIAREYNIAPDGRVMVVEPSERRPTVSHLQAITNWHRLLP